jgi:hypothetical protein
VANLRNQAARDLWNWIVEYYQKSGNVMASGVGGANDPWAALRVPSGNVGVLKLAQFVSTDGVSDPHLSVVWLTNVEWQDGNNRYRESDHVVWWGLSDVSVQDDALMIIEEDSWE